MCIRDRLLNGYEEIKLGDLTPTRDFLYVKDTARGFVDIAKSEKLIGQDCNIATNSEISMQELVDTLKDEINPSAKIVQDPTRLRPSKSEVYRLYGDNTKIMANTDWKPQYDFREGLKETIEWFSDKENLKNYKAGIYNV